MDATLNECDVVWKHLGKKCDGPRTDATFTEIYELILYNKIMMQSELEVLLQLIQKKLMDKPRTASPVTSSVAYRTIEEKNIATMIQSVWK